MNTIISNWQIVSVMDGEKLIGKVLWGKVVDDSTCRFLAANVKVQHPLANDMDTQAVFGRVSIT